jgi:AMMECR1 domain-containing protein
MANPRTGRVKVAAVKGSLPRPLPAATRQAIASDVRSWLRWQDNLTTWRKQQSAVNAIPFVALYANGQLRGCMGSGEGAEDESLARAFLAALGDTRFGGVRRADRPCLVAEVSFMCRPRMIPDAEVVSELEVGTHGVGLAREDGLPVFLLPGVARDGGLDAQGMLEALRRKAGPATGSLFLFETETIVVRPREIPGKSRSARGAAAEWLSSLITGDGALTFSVDARTGTSTPIGRMQHGRAATVIQALAEHGGYATLVARARAKLRRDIERALQGKAVPGWPSHPAEVAGTLALASRAGVGAEACLAYATAQQAAIAQVPWHAAQVVTALGARAPRALWDACVRDLERQPWAPWTVLAHHARGDAAGTAAPIQGLVAAIRLAGPHRGAVIAARQPEVAITALTVEALSCYRRARGAGDAIRRAHGFLLAQQLNAPQIPAPFVAAAAGAFLATPTSSLLRGDVTAHALMALP